MSWAELERFQTGAAVLLLSSPTGECRQGKQQFCCIFFFCSYSIILVSREPALIHSFLLWVKEGSRKDKRTRGCFDKRHMDCSVAESCCKMLQIICTLLSRKTSPYSLPSFSVGFYRFALRQSRSRHDTELKQRNIANLDVKLRYGLRNVNFRL